MFIYNLLSNTIKITLANGELKQVYWEDYTFSYFSLSFPKFCSFHLKFHCICFQNMFDVLSFLHLSLTFCSNVNEIKRSYFSWPLIFFSRFFWRNNFGNILGIPWGTCVPIFINLGYSGAVSIGGALYAPPPVAAKQFHMLYGFLLLTTVK